MDPKSFYSKKKVPARPIPNPEISEESDLSSGSDDDTDFVPDPNLESETEDETNVSESDSDTDLPQPAPLTSTNPAKMLRNDPLRWKTVPKEHVDLKEILPLVNCQFRNQSTILEIFLVTN